LPIECHDQQTAHEIKKPRIKSQEQGGVAMSGSGVGLAAGAAGSAGDAGRGADKATDAFDDIDDIFDSKYRQEAEARYAKQEDGEASGAEEEEGERSSAVGEDGGTAGAEAVLEKVKERMSVGDLHGAEALFIQSLKAKASADVTAGYAAFLWQVRGDLQGADTLSQVAVEMHAVQPVAAAAAAGAQEAAAPRATRQHARGHKEASLVALTTRAQVLKYMKRDAQGAYDLYQRAMRAYRLIQP
jgi:hypothetical protein